MGIIAEKLTKINLFIFYQDDVLIERIIQRYRLGVSR